MNDKQTWQVARLDDIERRDRDIPVREHFGIHAFGINAYTPGEEGTLIGEHDETGSGQEELYIVLDGKATFEIDGQTVDAPAGTFVFVAPESRRRATGDGTVLAVGATPGEAYEGVDWGDAWPFHSESMTAYGEQRYADALEAVRSGLEHMPDHAGLHYNYACFATLAGATGDDTFAHLRLVRRAAPAVPRGRAQRRRLLHRARRPAVRGRSSLSPAPDWTNFNHSDSGATLLQLFALLAFAFLVGLALKRWRRSRSAQ